MHAARAALLLIASLSTLFADAASVSRRASVCNGYSELCSKTFGNVTFVGAHDSYAVATGNLAANQDYDVTTQLNDGIRMLQVQAHNSSGAIHLCHTSCSLLDAGLFSSYLSNVTTWLNSNPNEVISILIVNIDNLAPSAFAAAYQAAKIDSLSYSPTSATLGSNAWPTLGELIDSGKRVLSFIDNQADFNSVPYLIDEFSNVWETAYDVTDQAFDCNLNRTGTADNKMYLINHFLDKYQTLLGFTFPVPDKDNLNVTNAVTGYGSLGLQASQCAAQYSKYPTFMLVDYYNWGLGSVFEVAATANGVTYTQKAVATPITSGSSSGTTSGVVSTGRSNSGISLQISSSVFGVMGAALGIVGGGMMVFV